MGHDAARHLIVADVRPRIQRARRGGYRLRLPPEERAILRSLRGQIEALLGTDDPSLRRLFPPGYADDPELEAEYRGLVRDDLLSQKREALRIVEETIDRDHLTEEQLAAWLGAVNDLRLVLGTRLDVTEEMYEEGLPQDDPRAPSFAVYGYLGWLEEQVVESLAAELDASGG
jgi:Domain of unknown function (DUF2017)